MNKRTRLPVCPTPCRKQTRSESESEPPASGEDRAHWSVFNWLVDYVDELGDKRRGFDRGGGSQVSDVLSSVRVGYDRWANVYDHDANPLQALEEPFMRRAVPRASKRFAMFTHVIVSTAMEIPSRSHSVWE